jgi:hypothetical protein
MFIVGNVEVQSSSVYSKVYIEVEGIILFVVVEGLCMLVLICYICMLKLKLMYVVSMLVGC